MSRLCFKFSFLLFIGIKNYNKVLMELIIDTREHGLIKMLKENDISFNIEQLELGDVVLRKNEEILLIIERKSILDLKASIVDGRNREQKARLLKTFPQEKILYLIEGSFNKDLGFKMGGIPLSTLIGSMVNTMFRDGIKVYKTESMVESVNFIIKMKDKFDEDGDKFYSNIEISDEKYSSSLKKSKKANMTPNVWFISQLSLIPQVTEKIAVVIIEKYPRLVDLMVEYENTPEHLRPKLLADLTFELQSGKTRRIGDSISGRIYKFFYSIND